MTNAVDRSGQTWMATPWGAARAVSAEEHLGARLDDQPHPCLIVEPPQLGAAHTSHPAIDLVTGERCRLLEDTGDSWEELTAALRREGALHMAPVRL